MQTSDLRKFTNEIARECKFDRCAKLTFKQFRTWITIPVSQRWGSGIWTCYVGEGGLEIKTAMDENGVQYVDSIEYGRNLANIHSHHVSPFYIFDILNDDGKAFFKNFYKDAIAKHIAKLDEQAKKAQQELEEAKAFWAQF